jgi:DegV family protein with EDD domain
MKYRYKIVVDSSSNLPSDFISDPEVGFEVVPLVIRIDGKDYVDHPGTDPEEMLKAFHTTKEKPTTSCPSPEAYLKSYQDAENVLAVTISSRLSGSFNSAYVASIDAENSRVHVIDSMATAGNMMLIVDKAYALIKEGLPMQEIEDRLDEYVHSLNLLFVLDSFEALMKAGRVNKAVAFVASTLGIKAVCEANAGEIKLSKQARNMKKALLTLIELIGTKVTDFQNRTCVIAYVEKNETVDKLESLIKEKYPFKEIRLVRDGLLCSYYALEGGIIVSF